MQLFIKICATSDSASIGFLFSGICKEYGVRIRRVMIYAIWWHEKIIHRIIWAIPTKFDKGLVM